MSETRQRHDWRPGLVQHCGNVGCRWQRRNRADARGNATTVFEYRWGSDDPSGWQGFTRVPTCEDRR